MTRKATRLPGLRFLQSFSYLFVTTGAAAFLLYFGTEAILARTGMTISAVRVTDGYHSAYLRDITDHPFAFLLSISFFTALFGALWVSVLAPKYRHLHFVQLLVVPWVALIVTSPVWGLIWSIYRHPRPFADETALLHYRYDAMFGLTLGWISAVVSVPINLLSYSAVCLLLFSCKKLFLDRQPGI